MPIQDKGLPAQGMFCIVAAYFCSLNRSSGMFLDYLPRQVDRYTEGSNSMHHAGRFGCLAPKVQCQPLS